VLGGSAVAVSALTAPPQPTAGPRGSAPAGLLPWPTRGPLAHDAAAVRTAESAAALELRQSHRAAGPPRVLWVGPATDGPHRTDGADRFAITQQLVAAEPNRVYLQWLYGSTTNRWTVRASGWMDRTAAGATFLWPYELPCVQVGNPATTPGCGPGRNLGLLVVGAPDVTSVRYQLSGGVIGDAPATDGIGFATLQVAAATVGVVRASVEVVLADGRRQSLAFGVPAMIDPSPPGGVDWSPRGLPPLLDAPETFPGLDLWGRLHGLGGRPAYGNPVWGGTLADGSRAVIARPSPGAGRPDHLVVAVNPAPIADTSDTFLVRDLPNPADATAVRQVSAYLPLSDGRCELVVVGEPATTAVWYAENGSSYSRLPVAGGVGTLVLPSCAGHGQARIAVRAGRFETYRGPVDSTLPGGGVKQG
jgi:hypothetical protein